MSEEKNKRFAVLVIDELGDVNSYPADSGVKEAYERTAQLLEVAHAAQTPVVFLNDAHLPQIDHELILWGEHGMAGTPDAQVSSVLPLCENDYVIEKRRYSGFFQTSLRLLLSELDVDTVILCGIDTNICVQHTAADAYFNNFNVIVVSDATATFLYGTQDAGLSYMKAIYDAQILTTEEISRLLAS